MQKTAHKLKKIANCINTKVVFSAPEKLAKLCTLMNPFHKASLCCVKKHRSQFVACAEGSCIIYHCHAEGSMLDKQADD